MHNSLFCYNLLCFLSIIFRLVGKTNLPKLSPSWIVSNFLNKIKNFKQKIFLNNKRKQDYWAKFISVSVCFSKLFISLFTHLIRSGPISLSFAELNVGLSMSLTLFHLPLMHCINGFLSDLSSYSKGNF